MANPLVLSLQLVAAVSNGIAQSQAVAGAGPLTLNGSLVTSGVAIMDVARRVLVASAGADSAVSFKVNGTDWFGNVIAETVTGVSSTNSVYTLASFKTVTSVVASAATAGNITVGTNTVGSTPWAVLDWLRLHGSFSIGGGITGPAGTTYTLEQCYSDPNSIAGQNVSGSEQWSMSPLGLIPPHVYTNSGVSAANGDSQFNYQTPVFAIRLTINSGTGLVTLEAIQAGV